MKHTRNILAIIVFVSSAAFSQRLHETHTRSMLRQTIYNTGELGRALEGSNSNIIGITEGTSALEWPPNSLQILDGTQLWGQQNSQGSGLVLRTLVRGNYEARACGGITDGSGNATAIAGVYVNPGPITRVENYPLLENGDLNPSYNPNEAEEIITTSYTTTAPMNLMITQTSRAWSFPGYDAFIIIEYDIVNRDSVDYTDGFVMFQNAFSPSALGLQRKYGVWNESSVTSRSREEYARYNFSRLMTYVHTRDGFPDQDYFTKWSTPGDRGGLDSPQAVGFLPLHYDSDNLQQKQNTLYAVSDSMRVWDEDGKFKQPYAVETNGNRNQEMNRTIALGLSLSTHSPVAFNNRGTDASPSYDSTQWAQWYPPYKECSWNSQMANPEANQAFIDYWHGRMKPRAYAANGYTNAFFHYTSFGPYVFPKNGTHLKFAIAQVVGYGPGAATDTVWRDAGGGSSTTTSWFLPVPSWHDSLVYPGVSAIAGLTSIGSSYLQTHEIPWYVTAGNGISRADTSKVISIRDAADRAIQMYTGDPLIKYDGVQFKPELTPATGRYGTTTTYIPIPAPSLNVFKSTDHENIIVWGPMIERFTSMPNVHGAKTSGRIKAEFSHYLVLKSSEALGPWTRLDSIAAGDLRFFNRDVRFPGMYVIVDTTDLLVKNYYAVVSVDSLGGKSGMTNISVPEPLTQVGTRGADLGLPKHYGLMNNFPNPFNPSTVIAYTVPMRSMVTLVIYDMLGRVVRNLVKDVMNPGAFEAKWDGRNDAGIRVSSGMYIYRMEAGPFVSSKKMLLLQ